MFATTTRMSDKEATYWDLTKELNWNSINDLPEDTYEEQHLKDILIGMAQGYHWDDLDLNLDQALDVLFNN
jgi:hypothetical protein